MNWKIGVEFELLAPEGISRRLLAEQVAKHHSGTVSTFWHPQVEPSMVPGMQMFHNLTPGFRVVDRAGQQVADFVGDVTIKQQLNRKLPSKKGWYRILTDDLRLLHLIARHASTQTSSLPEILQPVAELFGTKLFVEDDVVRVEGEYRHPVALGTGLPGERERVTELVTGKLTSNYECHLEELLQPAREMGFSVAMESATHIHFDGSAFMSPRAFRNVVELLHRYRLPLRYLFQTNPNCIRLGEWPDEFMPFVRSSDFVKLNWEEAKLCLRDIGLTKFCDINVRNLVFDVPNKQTIEIRILPGLISAKPVLVAAEIISLVFVQSLTKDTIPSLEPLAADEQSVLLMLKEIDWKNPPPFQEFRT
jgi:hypothetical protein